MLIKVYSNRKLGWKWTQMHVTCVYACVCVCIYVCVPVPSCWCPGPASGGARPWAPAGGWGTSSGTRPSAAAPSPSAPSSSPPACPEDTQFTSHPWRREEPPVCVWCGVCVFLYLVLCCVSFSSSWARMFLRCSSACFKSSCWNDFYLLFIYNRTVYSTSHEERH